MARAGIRFWAIDELCFPCKLLIKIGLNRLAQLLQHETIELELRKNG